MHGPSSRLQATPVGSVGFTSNTLGPACLSRIVRRHYAQQQTTRKTQTMKHTLRQLSIGIAALLLAAAPLDSSAAPRHSGIQGRTFSYSGPIWDGPPPLVIPLNLTTHPVATAFTVTRIRIIDKT